MTPKKNKSVIILGWVMTRITFQASNGGVWCGHTSLKPWLKSLPAIEMLGFLVQVAATGVPAGLTNQDSVTFFFRVLGLRLFLL